MIQIDDNEIIEKVCEDKPFVCCFINDNNNYKCFVHTVSPSKKIYEIDVGDEGIVGDPQEQDYNSCWYMLNLLYNSREPNSKKFRNDHAMELSTDWKLVNSNHFCDEKKTLFIRNFLLEKLNGILCELKLLPDDLSNIDGEIELKE